MPTLQQTLDDAAERGYVTLSESSRWYMRLRTQWRLRCLDEGRMFVAVVRTRSGRAYVEWDDNRPTVGINEPGATQQPRFTRDVTERLRAFLKAKSVGYRPRIVSGDDGYAGSLPLPIAHEIAAHVAETAADPTNWDMPPKYGAWRDLIDPAVLASQRRDACLY